MKILRFFFFSSIILTGFVSGVSFANAVRYLPAMEDTPIEVIIPISGVANGNTGE